MWGDYKGRVILAGFSFLITELSLRGGRVCIDAQCRGPLPALDGPVTIFGEDGQGFGQADTDLRLPSIGEHEMASIHLTISVDSLESTPQGG